MHRGRPAGTVVLLIATALVLATGAPTVAGDGASSSSADLTVCPGGSCDFTSIQDAVDAADPGDTILVKDGVYEESVLIEKDGLTLRGESESGVVIDVSDFDDRRGITARPANNDGFDADKLENLTIESLTVVGPSLLDDTSQKHYGIHVFDASDLLVEEVTVRDSSRSELDIHAIDGGRLADVTLQGNGTSGVGLGITDSHRVDVEDLRTEDNSWGGVGIFTSGSFAPGGTSDVAVENHTSLAESPPLYTQTHDGHPITDLTLPQYDHVANHPDLGTFTFYFQDLAPALDFAAGLDDAVGDGATVQDRADGTFHVGPGMTIQAAVDAADPGGEISVKAGDYVEQVVADTTLTIVGEAGARIVAPDSLEPDADDHANVVTVTGDGVEVEITGFTITGPGPSTCGSIHSGVAVTYDARATIVNNTIVSIRDDPVSGCQNGVGVTVGRVWHDTGSTSTAEASIRDNVIADFQKSAVVVAGDGSEADVVGNELVCSGDRVDDVIAQDAIQLWQSASGLISRNRITECRSTFHGSPRGVGVHLSEGVHDVRISNNEIPGAQTAIALMNFASWTEENLQARDLAITGNAISDVDGGVYLAGSADGVEVRRNTITNASVLGVFVGPDSWLQDPPDLEDVTVSNNDLRDNDAPALYVKGSAANVTARFNRIAGNSVGLLNVDDATVDAEHNWWGSATGPNATGNPLQGHAPTGDDVEGPADVTPWCKTEGCTAERPLHNLLLHPHPG